MDNPHGKKQAYNRTHIKANLRESVKDVEAKKQHSPTSKNPQKSLSWINYLEKKGARKNERHL